jgi:hypothetical protein
MPADTFEGALLNTELTNPDVQIVAHLFKNLIPIDADKIELADLTECDFVGYESKTLENPFIDVFDEENYAEAFFQDKEWTVGAIVTPQVVYGCYVTVSLAGVGTVLNAVRIFETPIVLDTEGQRIVRKFSICATSEAVS